MVVPYVRQLGTKSSFIIMLIAKDKSKLFGKLIFLLKQIRLVDLVFKFVYFIRIFVHVRKHCLFFFNSILLILISHIDKLISLIL